MNDALYSNAVLQLAADIPHLGALAHPQASVRKVSRLCGSEVEIDLSVDNGRISDLALRVKACALGQASASIFARHAIGASEDEVFAARDALRDMLKTGGQAPHGRFDELAVLEGARDYAARHQSILLAFNAAVEAIETARETSTTRLTG
ncbi:MAG: iron-sulfur cluster assembly scaffold protein [Alphaproteobacteria bacterium]|nr:iron-sulfur cluster assembly scaffold protein [Alphaproteobacteria bacterium]